MSSLEPGSLRGAAVRLRASADALEVDARRLDATVRELAHHWRGAAADAGLAHLARLGEQARGLAGVHDRAADALTGCAGAFEEALALGRRAEALRLVEERSPRPAASAFGPTSAEGVPELYRGAARLALEARQLEQAATARVVAVLQELVSDVRARVPKAEPVPLTFGQQLWGVPVGLYESSRDLVSFLVGFTRTAAMLDPEAALNGARTTAEGLALLVQEPRETLPLLVRADLIADGRYGEWVGGALPDLVAGLVSGGALPAVRRTMLAADRLESAVLRAPGDPLPDFGADQQPRTRTRVAVDVVVSQSPQVAHLQRARPDAGGLVRTTPGALLASSTPDEVADLSPGQRAGVLSQARRSLPASARWDDDVVVSVVMHAATHPLASIATPSGTLVEGRVDDIVARVLLDGDGQVLGATLSPG